MKTILIIVSVLIVLGIILGGWFMYYSRSVQVSPSPTPTVSKLPAPGSIVIKGQLVCLPHHNTDGPQTLECAYGLKDTSGRYFAISDTDPTYSNIGGIAMNTDVEVTGDLTLKEDDKYQSIGIIKVTKITKLSANPTSESSLTLPTKYITAVDWPPAVRLENKVFVCNATGRETDRAGQTEMVEINNHTYCVTKVSEGAAGSVYTQYAYARAKNNQTEIYAFSLRASQCGNYPEPEKTDCDNERQSFIIDNFVDNYIQSQLF